MKNIRYILAFLAVGVSWVVADAQEQNGNAYLKNDYIQMALSPYGCYGSEDNTVPPGYEMPGNAANGGSLGFIISPDNSWPNYYGDFVLPGSPYEGFSLTFRENSNRMQFMNDRNNGGFCCDITPLPTPFVYHSNTYTGHYDDVSWFGEVPGYLEVECRFQLVGRKVLHSVMVKNISSSTLTDIYFARGMDPDQEAGYSGFSGCGSAHNTYNVIESQADGTPGKPAWVAAYGFCTPAAIAYYCLDPRSRVGISEPWYELLYTPEFAYPYDTLIFGYPPPSLYLNEGDFSRTDERDWSIEIALFFGDLQPGQSDTMVFDVMADQPPMVRFDDASTLTTTYEGQSVTFDLIRVNYLEEAVTATVRLTAVSNFADEDIIGVSTLPHDYYVVFDPYETAKTLTLTAANDCYNLDYKTFDLEIVAVLSAVGGQMSPPNIATGIIRDMPPVVSVPVTLSASTSTVCSGTAATLTATAGGSYTAMTYTWKRDGSSIGTTTVNTFNVANITAIGTYTVSVISNSACTGTSTNTVTIAVNPTPSVSASASPSTVCSGGTVTFTASTISGATSPMTYTWNIGGTSTATTVTTYSRTMSTTSSYSLSARNTYGCTSSYTAPQTVTVNPVPVINSVTAIPNPVCTGTPVTFTANMGGGVVSPMTYTWNIGGTVTTTSSNTYSRNLPATSSYSVNAANSYTCTSGSTAPQTVTVSASATPTVTISSNKGSSVCSGTTVTYNVTGYTAGGTSPTFQWRVNGTPVPGETGNSFTYEPANNDVITCVMTTNDPCASSPTAISNSITMTVTPTVIPSVTITATPQ